MEIFIQRQQKNDLCRLYSLNNYFGYKKITEEQFYKYCNNYDKINIGLNTKIHDGFMESRCIINYIIDILDNKYSLLIPINNYKNARENINIDYYKKQLNNYSSYFEFNKNHIWINKKINNTWYKIDSISGINQINCNLGNNGYILIFDKSQLYDELINYIKLFNIKSNCKELIYYKIYNILKFIDLKNYTNNTIFNSNLSLLKNIFKYLCKYIEEKRKVYSNFIEIDYCVKIIDNSIKLFEL